ncbi:tetratricopeptide repeat protein [Nocardia brasiliensis]|uniref:tetratricopeptide repeat protein n=1 Tax=Nocardia brasiliensis TaxID=37326 RepID=UPI003D92CAAF
MGGRLALVIGSECAVLPRLSFPKQLAWDLYSSLSERGAWQPATSYDGPIVDPTATELLSAMDEAFRSASTRQATLLISFVGHGRATGASDFYLLAVDTPEDVNLHNAFHLPQEIRERLNRASLDGLIVLVDACETGQAFTGAATRWFDRIDQATGRMELLVAADDGSAYGGCFTRTMVQTFATGLDLGGANLLPSDLRSPIATTCIGQHPSHLGAAFGGDAGLWLVPNVARHRDAVAGRRAAGLVDQLTRGVVLTATLRRRLEDVVNARGRRLRAVVGSAGCGKSTLMSLLVRPDLVGDLDDQSPRSITAAVFLDVSSSLESFVDELATQLTDRVAGFAEAREEVERAYRGRSGPDIDQFALTVTQPLSGLREKHRITIVVDGLDQPRPGTREFVVAAVAELTTRADLRNVHVITGIREGAGIEHTAALGHMCRIDLQPPTARDIAGVIGRGRAEFAQAPWAEWIGDAWHRLAAQAPAGGWLLARLLAEIVYHRGGDTDVLEAVGLTGLIERRVAAVLQGAEEDSATLPVLGVLTAAGAGTVLPIELLRAALADRHIALSEARIRDRVVALGALIARGSPGVAEESLGIAHSAFVAPLMEVLRENGFDLRDGHRAIAAALAGITSAQATEYASGSAVRHYLAYGDSAAALRYLESLDTGRASDNRDRWAAWLPAFHESADPLDVLRARYNLAWWRGESGDKQAAVEDYERLLADRRVALGDDHPETLDTRDNLAWWHGKNCEIAHAVAEYRVLLRDRLRVLGSDDVATLRARGNLSYWRGRGGDFAGAIADTEALLHDRVRVLGRDDPDTLATRSNLAWLHGRNGEPDRAVHELRELLDDRRRVLGPEHPSTLATRFDLAQWRGKSGDIAGATADSELLLTDERRIFGPDDLHTFGAWCHFAKWIGHGGDTARAVAELERLLAEQTRVLGKSNIATLSTRNRLAWWRVQNGETARGIVGFEQVLADRRRILGPDHTDTLRTRYDLARCRGRAGDVPGAVTELERVLADRIRVLGVQHPHTRKTVAELEYWRGST